MERVLDAFEKLLRKNSYETITINDIAAESSTGAGSIYARFDGKRSILLALHARTRDRARKHFQKLFNPADRAGEDVGQAIERIARGMLSWHKRHRYIIKTSLLLNDADIYEGISASFRPWSKQLALLLKARGAELSEAAAATTAVAIIQIMIAVLQQRVIFGSIAPIGNDLSDEQLVKIIKAAALGQLSAPFSLTA